MVGYQNKEREAPGEQIKIPDDRSYISRSGFPHIFDSLCMIVAEEIAQIFATDSSRKSS